MPIIWEHADGTVSVMKLSDKYLTAHRRRDETTEQAVLRLAGIEQAKSPELSSASAALVTTASMPSVRTARHKWRLLNGVCVVDPTIPDRPDRRTGLADALDRATTLDDIKTILMEYIH